MESISESWIVITLICLLVPLLIFALIALSRRERPQPRRIMIDIATQTYAMAEETATMTDGTGLPPPVWIAPTPAPPPPKAKQAHPKQAAAKGAPAPAPAPGPAPVPVKPPPPQPPPQQLRHDITADQVAANIINRRGHMPAIQRDQMREVREASLSLNALCCGNPPLDVSGSNQFRGRLKCGICGRVVLFWRYR